MARGDLLCPLDGTVLGLPNWQIRGGTVAETDDHYHITFNATFTCSDGHRWRAKSSSDLTIERVQ